MLAPVLASAEEERHTATFNRFSDLRGAERLQERKRQGISLQTRLAMALALNSTRANTLSGKVMLALALA
jgi:hypothetical protein